MDDTIKLTSVSVIVGIIVGVISGLFTIGALGFKNDMVGLLLAIIAVYALSKTTNKIVNEELDRTQKIWDWFFPFFFSWIIVWVLIANYM